MSSSGTANLSLYRTASDLNSLGTDIGKTRAQLSSGLRINPPVTNDSGSQVLASSYTKDLSSLKQGASNISAATDLVSFASDALSEIDSLTLQIASYASTASNAVTSSAQRAGLDTEVDAISSRISSIISSTTYNGKTVLDGSYASNQVQIGASPNQRGDFSIKDVSYLPSSLSGIDLSTQSTATAAVTAATTLYSNLQTEETRVNSTIENFQSDLIVVSGEASATAQALTNVTAADNDRGIQSYKKQLTQLTFANVAFAGAAKSVEAEFSPLTSLGRVNQEA